jgi:hypothetical protein
MSTSKMSVRVAARHLLAQDDRVRGPAALLKAVEGAQSALHGAVRLDVFPADATPEERRKLAGIVRAAKAMYEQTEEVRLDLDEWIIDYGEARRGS